LGSPGGCDFFASGYLETRHGRLDAVCQQCCLGPAQAPNIPMSQAFMARLQSVLAGGCKCGWKSCRALLATQIRSKLVFAEYWSSSWRRVSL